MKKYLIVAALAALPLLFCGCTSNVVYVYTDVDRHAVSQLFEPFTKQTGIAVNIVHFSDAQRLVEAISVEDGSGGYRLAPHKGTSNPDLMLSSEMFAAEVLRGRNALDSYRPSGAQTIPAGAKVEDQWYGVGPRAWVLMWNTQKAPEGFAPVSLMDLASESLDMGGVCMVPPNYSPYYASAVAANNGTEAATAFYQRLIDRQTVFIAQPEHCAQRIAQGQAQAGLTTLAAALAQQKNGAPVAWALPDQAVGQMGAYAPFYSLGLIKEASHGDNAKLAEEYLLTLDAEKRMVSLGLSDATLRDCGADIPVVVPLAISLEEASGIYNKDLAGFIRYFQRYDPPEEPRATVSAS